MTGWARSPDRWLRRSALVATVGAKAEAARTLAVCAGLAADRDDMVVKALSWALRELSATAGRWRPSWRPETRSWRRG